MGWTPWADGDEGDGDPDDDGLSNAEEHTYGTDPKKLIPTPTACQMPGATVWARPVGCHRRHGAGGDPDNDGLSNAGELQHGTDPGTLIPTVMVCPTAGKYSMD